MANLLVLPLFAFLCLLSSLLVPAFVIPKFIIQGRVYCDNCCTGFETSATVFIEGAKVRLVCKHYSNDTVVHTTEGVTNNTRTYNLKFEDDHQQEICEVILVHNPLFGCNETKEGRDRARVALTQNNGIPNFVHYANSLSFLKDKSLPIYGEVLRQSSLEDEE